MLALSEWFDSLKHLMTDESVTNMAVDWRFASAIVWGEPNER